MRKIHSIDFPGREFTTPEVEAAFKILADKICQEIDEEILKETDKEIRKTKKKKSKKVKK